MLWRNERRKNRTKYKIIRIKLAKIDKSSQFMSKTDPRFKKFKEVGTSFFSRNEKFSCN